MDKKMMEKVKYFVAWRGVAWRGVRAGFTCLLAALIILSQLNITAFADDNISYIEGKETKTIQSSEVTTIKSDNIVWGDDNTETKWFVTDGDVTINSRVEIKGNIHLILKDGSSLTIKGGIHLAGTNSLTIYGQENGTGQLITQNVSTNNAGIGGNYGEGNATLTIYGGKITAIGGGSGAGIGSGCYGRGGTVTISGGVVIAKGGNSGAGIGNGANGNEATITISGGDVTATGGVGGAGIGCGFLTSLITITVSGGTVTATGGKFGAGIGGGLDCKGGTTTVSGGVVTATGGTNSVGIGSNREGASGTFSTGTDGSAVIHTNGIADHDGIGSWRGLIFEEGSGKIYGGTTFTLQNDLNIPSGSTLDIEKDKKLNIPSTNKLTNKGTVTNNGTIENDGTIINEETLMNNVLIINMGEIKGTVSGNGEIHTPPRITIHPQDKTVTVLNKVQFTVEVLGYPKPTYQWQVNTGDNSWKNIENATSDTYTINSASLDMSGNKYRCQISNYLGNVTSNEASLIVEKALMPTPEPKIDYRAEKITGLTVGSVYKIKVDNNTEEEIEANQEGNIAIIDKWFGTKLSIKAKLIDDNHLDSEAKEINIPRRPDAPSKLNAVNETFAGEEDGKITGTDSKMEYMKPNDTSWIACTGDSISSLAPGIYQVRVAATDNSFVSKATQVEVLAGQARTYTLKVTQPTFEAVEYGYTQPSAKHIIIQNTGNSISTISEVTLDSTDSFILGGSGNSVNVGSSIDTYTVQPKAGLGVGTHIATITVKYTNSETATAKVSFTVNKSSQSSSAGFGFNPDNKAGKLNETQRISGEDRIETSVKISKKYYKNAEYSIIVGDNAFADSLSASVLAGSLKAPILLNNKNVLNRAVKDEIERLQSKKVIVVGGENTISKNVINELSKSGISVEVISGKDRYETSAEVAKKIAKISGGYDSVVVASGEVFADTLSISPFAVKNNLPIVLVSKNNISREVKNVISMSKTGKVLVVGGSNTISNSLKAELGDSVESIYGKDRYETSVLIAQKKFSDSKNGFLASGETYADALVIGSIAGHINSPIILTPRDSHEYLVKNYINNSKIEKLIVVGGVKAVSDSTVDYLTKK